MSQERGFNWNQKWIVILTAVCNPIRIGVKVRVAQVILKIYIAKCVFFVETGQNSLTANSYPASWACDHPKNGKSKHLQSNNGAVATLFNTPMLVNWFLEEEKIGEEVTGPRKVKAFPVWAGRLGLRNHKKVDS